MLSPLAVHSYFCLDVIFGAGGELFLVEANGSNANLTSTALGHDVHRARHMASSFRARREDGVAGVMLVPFANRFTHAPELFARIANFVSELSDLDIAICSATEPVAHAETTLVIDTVDNVAQHVARCGDALLYCGEPVVFMVNPNLLGALTRQNIISRRGDGYDVSLAVLHEGPAALVVEDKARQQMIIRDDGGFSSLRPRVARSVDDAVLVLEKFAEEAATCVGKINAGSGGVGVEFFPSSLSREFRKAKLYDMLRAARMKYGPSYEKTAFPISFVRFAPSRGVELNDGLHLWDARFECLHWPGRVDVYPGLIRICPSPFHGDYTRGAVVSNLTGRSFNSQTVRSGWSEETLLEFGLVPSDITRAATACGEWVVAATADSVRQQSAAR